MTRPARPAVTPLSAARYVCGLPGCRNAVVPPAQYCRNAHKQAAYRLRHEAAWALRYAVLVCGVAISLRDAGTVVRKAGMGVTAAFIETVTGWVWDETEREWR